MAPTQPPPHVEEVQEHRLGEKYGAANPMPTIERYLQHNKEREALSKQQAEEAKNLPVDQQRATAAGSDKPTARPGGSKTSDVPIGDDKTNVLLYKPPTVDMQGVFEAIEKQTRSAAYITAGTIVVLNFLFVCGGITGILRSLFPAAGVAIAVFFVLTGVAEKGAAAKHKASEPQVEKIKYLPESVEWMNSLIDTVWQVVSEEVFKGLAKTVEDQIKAVIPAAVGGVLKVKISDLGQGTNAVRVLSMRSLPDSEFHGLVPTHGQDKNASPEEVKKVKEAAAREEGGIFYNLELAVAYHGEPLSSHKKKIHFDMVIMAGPVPLPIFIETKEFVMTVRIRMQLHPDIPFLKSITFAFTETPKIHASVALGFSGAFNLLNLPFLDSLIESQIKSNTAELTVPKSMNLDMTPYLGGDDSKLEVNSVGLLFIKIHRADNLARQDSRGPGADPYITIAFSKYEKPMYATKMIVGELNPIWEESCCILINADHIKRQENLLLKLWDSDRSSPDDVTGQIEVPLQDLVKAEGKMFKRKDQLQEEVAGENAQGTLHWEVGYFPRAPFKKEHVTEEARKDSKDEKDWVINATTVKPDPEYPTGILSVSIYQCINIEVPNPRGDKKDPEPQSKEEQEDDEVGVVEGYLPSIYCTADVNDQFSCRTRVKSITKAPIFNSSIEMYVSDWRNIIISVAARDQRKKGKDFLVGAVTLKAVDIFRNFSTRSDWYDLVGGGGSGRVRVAVLFRSTTLKMEKQMLGWDLGRFEMMGKPLTVTGFKASRVKLRTGGPSKVLKASADGTFSVGELFRVPVFHRYLAPVIFEFFTGSDKKPSFYSIIWLHNVIDNETREFELTIYKTDNPRRFTQNVVESVENKLLKLEPVGTCNFMGRFKSGMCPEFKDCLDDPDEEDTFEVFDAMKKIGAREDHETDTGSDHPGNISGAGKARNPDSTYDANLSTGGHGVVSDKEARNATSHRTGDHVAAGNDMLPSHQDGVTRHDTNLSDITTDSSPTNVTTNRNSTNSTSNGAAYTSSDVKNAQNGNSAGSPDNISSPHFYQNSDTTPNLDKPLPPTKGTEPSIGKAALNKHLFDNASTTTVGSTSTEKDLPTLPRTYSQNAPTVPDDYHPAGLVSQPGATFSLPSALEEPSIGKDAFNKPLDPTYPGSMGEEGETHRSATENGNGSLLVDSTLGSNVLSSIRDRATGISVGEHHDIGSLEIGQMQQEEGKLKGAAQPLEKLT